MPSSTPASLASVAPVYKRYQQRRPESSNNNESTTSAEHKRKKGTYNKAKSVQIISSSTHMGP
jgi:hypothetical protein